MLSALKELSADRGLYTIVNESIDEHDGGVSGVAYRNVLEFAAMSSEVAAELLDVSEVTVAAMQEQAREIMRRGP